MPGATKELITFCRRLTRAQLLSATHGVCHSDLPGHPQPGRLLDTLDHLVLADADYLPRPRMERPMWALKQRHASNLDELGGSRRRDCARWQVYLEDPLEAADLSEPALLILISLADGPKHGYAMVQGHPLALRRQARARHAVRGYRSIGAAEIDRAFACAGTPATLRVDSGRSGCLAH